MKTVLAPNAPWPTKEEVKPKIIVKRLPKPVKSRQADTDKNFEKWASKNVGAI